MSFLDSILRPTLDDPWQIEYRLAPKLIDSLYRRFVGKAAKGRGRGAGLMGALNDPVCVERGLSGLSGDALAALTVIVDAGMMGTRDLLMEDLDLVIPSQARIHAALDELSAASLLLGAGPDGSMLGLDTCIAQPLSRFLPPVEGVRTEGVRVVRSASPRRDEALLVGAVAASRPRINRNGTINATDLKRLAKRLAREAPRIVASTGSDIGLALPHHLFVGEGRVQLNLQRAREHFEIDFALWREGWLARLFRNDCTYGRVLDLLRTAGSAWLPEACLRRVIRTHLRRHSGVRPGSEAKVDSALTKLTAPLDEGSDDGGERLFRLPQPMDHGGAAGCLVVQPNFEVHASPEAPPRVLLELSRFATLTSADVLAGYRIDEEAVCGAVDEGAEIDELFQLLAAHASRGVPQNVETTARGWVRGRGRVLISTDAVIFIDEAGTKGALERELTKARISFASPVETALLVDHEDVSRVRTILHRLKIRPRNVESVDDDDDEPDWASPDPDGLEDFDDLDALGEALDQRGMAAFGPGDAEVAKLRDAITSRMADRGAEEPSEREAERLRSPRQPSGRRLDATELRRELERCARRGAAVELDVRAAGGLAIEDTLSVRIDRLRRRGGIQYVECVNLDEIEAYAIPFDEIAAVRPIESAPPARRDGAKIGRNDPCHCGSGHKYKRCCLKTDAP